jgi:hypothetical protein
MAAGGGVAVIYLYHIKRTGGRSVIWSLLTQFGDPPAVWGMCHDPANAPCFEIEGKVIYPWHNAPGAEAWLAWSHLPMRNVVLPDDAFTVTIFRNPMDRVVSYYHHALASANIRDDAMARQMREWLGERRSLLCFARRLPERELLGQLNMFSATLDVGEALENIAKVSLYFHTEQHAEGLRELGQRLGLVLPPRHYRAGLLLTGRSPSPYPRPFIAERIILRRMLAPEYELLARLP